LAFRPPPERSNARGELQIERLTQVVISSAVEPSTGSRIAFRAVKSKTGMSFLSNRHSRSKSRPDPSGDVENHDVVGSQAHGETRIGDSFNGIGNETLEHEARPQPFARISSSSTINARMVTLV
jgi:hypothetical protein